jgi:hypothetical protein
VSTDIHTFGVQRVDFVVGYKAKLVRDVALARLAKATDKARLLPKQKTNHVPLVPRAQHTDYAGGLKVYRTRRGVLHTG